MVFLLISDVIYNITNLVKVVFDNVFVLPLYVILMRFTYNIRM